MLEIERSRTDASEDLLQAMLKGDFSVEQIRNVSKTKTLGERLRSVREMRNLGQRDLSEKTGVSQARS